MSGVHPSLMPPQALEAEERRFEALEHRKRGLSFRAIGKRMGCGYSTAWALVKEALDELRAKTLVNAEQLRELEIQKLDRLESKMQKGLASADLTERAKVAAVVVKITESRRKLLGLDAAQKVELSGNLYTVKEVSPDCESWGMAAKGQPDELPAMREEMSPIEGSGDAVAEE